MTQEFIKNPTLLIRQLLRVQATDASFEAGRLAMACEIVTVIRLLEDNVMLPDQQAGPILSVLQTLLSDQELDWVYSTYDSLSANRRPVFVPEPLPLANVDADGVGQVTESDDHASADGAPQQTMPPVETLRRLSVVRQSQDAIASDDISEEPDATAQGMQSE